MDQARLKERLLKVFLAELDEQVEEVGRDLLALEKSPPGEADPELVNRIFRAAHGLKGAARSVEVHLIESACHAMEDLFNEVRGGKLTLQPEHFRLLFSALDGFGRLAEQLRHGHAAQEPALNSITVQLKTACQSVATPQAAPGGPAAPPASKTQGASSNEPEQSTPAAGVDAVEVTERPEVETASAARPASNERTGSAPGSARSVRVDAQRLDDLVASAGELMVATRRLEGRIGEIKSLAQLVGRWRGEHSAGSGAIGQHLAVSSRQGTQQAKAVLANTETAARFVALAQRLEAFVADFEADHNALRQAAQPIEQSVRQVRMLSFRLACSALERTVRDLAETCGVRVALRIEGEHILLDRSVVEGIKNPLLHLVRNSIDHGIESPEERRAAGKPETGTLTVSAQLQGSRVIVSVTDDGRGIDEERVRRKAELVSPGAADTSTGLMELLCLPGFSTTDTVTNVSGRGVGMDAVRKAAEAMHGSLAMENSPGKGVRFTLNLPLTLTRLRAVLVRLGRHAYALDTTNVVRIHKFAPEDVKVVGGRDVVVIEGEPIPIVPLADLLGLAGADSTPGEAIDAILLSAGGKSCFISVDEFSAEEEIIVKPLGRRIRRIENTSGATILPDGSLALILNASDLIAATLGKPTIFSYTPLDAGEEPEARKRIIIADDTITTRTLESAIIESAGYEVMEAADGAQAWRLLREHGADLVVSDIEMPRMDGFALTEAIRTSPNLRDLPVILVTNMESEAHRQRGLEVGANAYILKRTFDQRELLRTIEKFI